MHKKETIFGKETLSRYRDFTFLGTRRCIKKHIMFMFVSESDDALCVFLDFFMHIFV